jgi:hypothetical protein
MPRRCCVFLNPSGGMCPAFLLAFPTEPQWLTGFQIAHHREKLLLLPQVNPSTPFVRVASPRRGPSLKDADRSRVSPPGKPKRRATCRADALSQAWPARLRALAEGALLGRSGTFSPFTPQSGHFTRYTSMYGSPELAQGRSRTARSHSCHRHGAKRTAKHSSLRLPRLRRTPTLILFFR